MVWRENWNAVQVFRRCQWDVSRVVAGDRLLALFERISAPEIESVCNLMSIPADARGDVLDGVRVMEAVSRPYLNR